ncbi:MAG: hypothetical protein JXA11_04425 [Phycisphaerae bacterium]|nr:hypothetical protein [Phycisphaerae bacterium]
MFKKHCFSILLVLTVLTGGVFAQQQQPAATEQPVGPDPNQPAAESIYKRIPADGLGFVAAKNFNGLLTQISTFAKQIGMGEQLEAMGPGGLLPMMAAMLQLGEGYNPNGGAAVVVLDFEKCGIDIGKMITGQGGDVMPPIVILLAGTNIEKAFPTQAQKDENGQLTVMLPVGDLPPLQAAQLGDYMALSPNPQALALMKTDASIEAKIPEGQKKLLADSDVLLHYNVEVLTPMLRKMVAAVKEQSQAAEEGQAPRAAMPAWWATMMGPLTDMLDEVISLSYGLRFVEDGMMIEAAVDYKPDSALGKLAASYTPTDKPLMNRLANLPYVLAFGMEQTHNPEYTRQMMKMLDMLLGMGDLEMPVDLRDRIVNLSDQMGEEVTAIQFVGGAPKDKGVFGVGYVIECKDADKLKTMLPREFELMTELIQKTIAMKEEDLKQLSFTYTEGVETVGDLSVDAIVVDFKELQEMSETDKKQLLDVLGEDKVRLLVAKVDANTLVMTFGGSTDMIAAVAQAAKAGPGVSSDPAVVQALAKLPKQRVAEMVFSPKNLFDTVRAGMKKMDEPSNLPADFAFTSEVPIAMMSTVRGTTGFAAMYVPSAAVKDIVAWGMAEAAAAMTPPPPPGEGAPPVKGESDF